MLKPHIKIEITRLPNRFLITGYYRYKGKQWNAGKTLRVKDYDEKISRMVGLVVTALIDRFNHEANK